MKIFMFFIVISLLLLYSCSHGNNCHKQILSAKAPKPIGPYSQAVRAGGTIYLAGQIAINPESGEMVTKSISDETTQVMKNLRAVLDEAGYTFDDVVKTTIFLTDLKNFSTVNEIYATYFKDKYPARETIQVTALPKGANVEISMIAVK